MDTVLTRSIVWRVSIAQHQGGRGSTETMITLRTLILVTTLAACATTRTTSGSLPPVVASAPAITASPTISTETTTAPPATAIGTTASSTSIAEVTTAVSGAVAATMGQPARLELVSITATYPVVGGDESGPWLTVTFHLENATDQTQGPISFFILCSGNPKAGTWQAGSTLQPNAGVPAKGVADGNVNLLLPGDTRTGVQRPACATPARLIAQGLSGQALMWAISDKSIAQMNAAP